MALERIRIHNYLEFQNAFPFFSFEIASVFYPSRTFWHRTPEGNMKYINLLELKRFSVHSKRFTVSKCSCALHGECGKVKKRGLKR